MPVRLAILMSASSVFLDCRSNFPTPPVERHDVQCQVGRAALAKLALDKAMKGCAATHAHARTVLPTWSAPRLPHYGD